MTGLTIGLVIFTDRNIKMLLEILGLKYLLMERNIKPVIENAVSNIDRRKYWVGKSG